MGSSFLSGNACNCEYRECSSEVLGKPLPFILEQIVASSFGNEILHKREAGLAIVDQPFTTISRQSGCTLSRLSKLVGQS